MEVRITSDDPTLTKLPITALNDAPAQFGYLIAKTANQWMAEAAARPMPADLWNGIIYEGDLAILFASSGSGKSILATQIAHEVSQRERVLYLDCEMSDKQFQIRYEGFTFNSNFIRVELYPEGEKPQQLSDEDFIIQSLEEAILSLGARILFVDNITYLRNDTEKAKDALNLMKRLKGLKIKHNLSILAIAHTPKRDQSRPLSQIDLAGSMMLYNFCDAVFAIGVGHDPCVRYVKQLKTRYTENIYGEDNVIVFEIEKRLDGFLGFHFVSYGRELDYLAIRDKDQRDEQIFSLSIAGHGVNEIARQLNVSNATVSRTLSKRNVTVKDDN
jgi:KaiC/GvpD/RAD55 family RecA-like ATPase